MHIQSTNYESMNLNDLNSAAAFEQPRSAYAAQAPANVYERKMYMYDNRLRNREGAGANQLTVKACTIVDLQGHRQSSPLRDLQGKGNNDWEPLANFANTKQLPLFQHGTEFKFRLNDFEECRKVMANQPELRDTHRVYKCSLIIFKVYTSRELSAEYEVNLFERVKRPIPKISEADQQIALAQQTSEEAV